MKIRLYDRLLTALAGLLLFASGLFVVLAGIGLCFQSFMVTLFGQEILFWNRVIVIGVGVLMLLLGLHSISLLIRPKKDKGFVFRQTEYGDMSVSMKALESMVRKCIDSNEELKAQQIRIDKVDKGIRISLKVLVSSGNSIPALVDSLQKQIKQYVSLCAGVDVVQVSVMVEADPERLALPALMAPEVIPEQAEITTMIENSQQMNNLQQNCLQEDESQDCVVVSPSDESISDDKETEDVQLEVTEIENEKETTSEGEEQIHE